MNGSWPGRLIGDEFALSQRAPHPTQKLLRVKSKLTPGPVRNILSIGLNLLKIRVLFMNALDHYPQLIWKE
jgi:hypothetical protein